MHTPGKFLTAKLNGRRHLVFQLDTGEVGASPRFNRREAVANAAKRRVVPDCGTLERTFASILRARGFILKGDAAEMSDNLGEAIEKEIFAK